MSPTAHEVTVAAVNFVARALTDFDDLVDSLHDVFDRAGDADVIVLPEMFAVGLLSLEPGWPDTGLDDIGRIADQTPRVLALLAEEARRRRVFILGGTLLTRNGDAYTNVATLFGPEGVVHSHTKTHLVPSERGFVTAYGSEMRAVALPFATIGINICYEIQFPEASGALVEQGAEIILCPSYTLNERGFWRVRNCAAARATENQVYVVNSCAGGEPDHALPGGYARSAVLNPPDARWANWDGVLAESGTNTDEVVVATLDLDLLREARREGEILTWADRRIHVPDTSRWASHLTAAGRA